MKRVIKSNVNSDEFVPEMSWDFVENTILPQLKSKVIERFGRRYKGIAVDLDDIAFEGNRMQAEVIVYNNGNGKNRGMFSFAAWDGYWDEDDFNSHLAQKINSFVSSL